MTAGDPDADVAQWALDRLIDYDVATSHACLRFSMPTIARCLAALEATHGHRHPEIARVSSQFDRVRRDLEQHLMKEEQVLFTYVRELATAPADCRTRSPFGTVEYPIRMMEREHHDAIEQLQEIRELTNDYTVPADGGATYEICMQELARFERDLRQHVALEDTVLFPKAIELEQAGSRRIG